jgi:hypothetical protein
MAYLQQNWKFKKGKNKVLNFSSSVIHRWIPDIQKVWLFDVAILL